MNTSAQPARVFVVRIRFVIAGVVCGVLAAALTVAHLFSSAPPVRQNAQATIAEPKNGFDDWKHVAAPELTVTTLEGDTFALSQLKGKRVIIDFWGTGCPACIREIPHFMKLREEFATDDLVIVGISEESEEALKSIVTAKGINYLVASASNLPVPYGDFTVTPTTVFVDRNGVIQEILAGYHDLDQITEAATRDDFTGEIRRSPGSGWALADHPVELVDAWALEVPAGRAICAGDWNDDGSNEILVAGLDGTLRIVDSAGSKIEKITIRDSFDRIELGRHTQDGVRLLCYSNYDTRISVLNRSGTTVCSFSSEDAIIGVHWCDLNSDGNDEIIIGTCGTVGLHALSPDGKRLWSRSKIGSVWNQAVIPSRNPSPSRIYVTNATGSIQVFDQTGKPCGTLRAPGERFFQISAARETANGSIQVVVAGDVIAAMNVTGDLVWSTPSQKKPDKGRHPFFTSGDIDGDGLIEWAFIDAVRELVLVNFRGEKLAAVVRQQSVDGFVIVNRPDAGLLVTLESGILRARRAKRSDAEPDANPTAKLQPVE